MLDIKEYLKQLKKHFKDEGFEAQAKYNDFKVFEGGMINCVLWDGDSVWCVVKISVGDTVRLHQVHPIDGFVHKLLLDIIYRVIERAAVGAEK